MTEDLRAARTLVYMRAALVAVGFTTEYGQ